MTTLAKKPSRRGKGGGDDPPSGGNEIVAALRDEAQRRYLNYALSVITSRALPDVRDGLKPVQRRIVYGMWNDLNLSSDAKYRKCAQVVGAIMGNYHPHGDAPVYEALVRMAQDFSLRYPIVDGHGNFGSLDGDAAAAYRYTECRLQPLASDLADELAQRTVDFRPNYDGTKFEPIVLPSRMPQLLMNGATGIAVGMATNIPPHNLNELCDALEELLANRKAETKDLLKHVKGPDFPTGGQILNSKKELRDIYETGQGAVRVRGEWKLEDLKRGGQQIVITSIPYAVNKSTLVAKIGDVVRERKLPPLLDVRDESTDDVRIVMELKRDSDPELVLAYLYKHTSLQTQFNVNMTCLVPTANPEVGAPERLDLKSMLQHFLDFRLKVVTRRLEHELGKIRERQHVLEGFEKVYDALDEMIRIIRKSEGKQDAAAKLIKRFELSDTQAEAILEMKLYKLARLEILVVQQELKEKRAEAKRLKELLGDEKKRWRVVRDEIDEMRKKYADKRRSRISGGVDEVEYSEDAFIADEDANIIVSRDGWAKRVREVKDPTATRLREGDEVMTVVAGSLKANVVFLTSAGSAYVMRFNDVPASTGYGDPVQKLFKFDDGERVVATFSLDPRFSKPARMVAVTKNGYGLRFPLAPHTEVSTRSGRRFAKPEPGDEVVGVAPAHDKDLLAVVSESSRALVCEVSEINELAGPGRGVTVIKLDEDDHVLGFLCTTKKDEVLELETTKGKKVSLSVKTYDISSRGGKGHQMSKRDNVKLVGTRIVWTPLPQDRN
ncbi:MAG: DNA topoisomerase (ATP-hydrolyzing) subunit A [Myxococcaceae bacterium]